MLKLITDVHARRLRIQYIASSMFILAVLLAGAGCADVWGIPGDLKPSTTTESPGPIILRDGRLSTLPAPPANVGALRISQQALEHRERTCTQDQTLCVTGGLTSRGRTAP